MGNHDVDRALKQRCAIVTRWRYTIPISIVISRIMYSMGNNIILANLVESQGLVNIRYKAPSRNTCQSNWSKALIGEESSARPYLA